MIIGIDFGKRIGLAYAVGGTAIPYCVVNSIKEAAEKIRIKKANKLVIGWPLLLDGSLGKQCEVTELMLKKLLELTGPMEFFLQDERFSSKFLKGLADEHAHSAAWILQIYLDVQNRLST